MPAAITGSWFENRIIPLDATTPDQPGVAMLVDAYNKENARRAAAGSPSGWARSCPAPPGPPRRGREPRPTLHRHRRVRRLPRARARPVEDDRARPRAVRAGAHRPRQGSLVRRLPRHRLPAAGRPGEMAEAREKFSNVGCEACHGAGKAHLGPPTSVVDRPRGARGDLPRLPHRRRHQRRVRLRQVREGDCWSRPRRAALAPEATGAPAGTSTIVGASMANTAVLALALALFGRPLRPGQEPRRRRRSPRPPRPRRPPRCPLLPYSRAREGARCRQASRAGRGAGARARATPDRGATFEALATERDAGPATSATLLSPFIDRCDAEKRDLDRARCRAPAYLRETLPQPHLHVRRRRSRRRRRLRVRRGA